MSSSKASERKRGSLRLIPIDFLVLAYSTIATALLVISGDPLSKRVAWIAFNLFVISVVFLISRLDTHSPVNAIRMLRRLYPLALFTFFYEQTQTFVHALYSGWFDSSIAALEAAVFGFQPSIAVGRLYATGLNEVIIGFYVSYYLWLPTAVLVFWLLKRESSADRLLLASTIAFFVSYFVFALCPVEGPRFHFAEEISLQMDGSVFVPLVHSIMKNAAVHGGAMPSSHTAVTLIALVAVYRESRKWGAALTLPAMGIAVGCVWGRFHYLLDVAAGAMIGIMAMWIAGRILRRNLLGAQRLKGID